MLGSSAGMHSHSITCWRRVRRPARARYIDVNVMDVVGRVSEARHAPLD